MNIKKRQMLIQSVERVQSDVISSNFSMGALNKDKGTDFKLVMVRLTHMKSMIISQTAGTRQWRQ